jgi:hypothetical protein
MLMSSVYQALIVVVLKHTEPYFQKDFQIKSFMRKSNVFVDRKEHGAINNDTSDDMAEVIDSIITKIKRNFLLTYQNTFNSKRFFIQDFNDIQIKSKYFRLMFCDMFFDKFSCLQLIMKLKMSLPGMLAT